MTSQISLNTYSGPVGPFFVDRTLDRTVETNTFNYICTPKVYEIQESASDL